MEVSQRPGQAEDVPGHRWAGILGTGVAAVTLVLPMVMIASYSPLSSNAQSIPNEIVQPQTAEERPMKY
ncbi:MAG: hypothetical protein AAFN00_08450 [Cyanobacteria bacterium J06558_2]